MPLLETRGSGSALGYGLGSASATKIITENLVLYLDAAEPSSYPGTGTIWYDISGTGNNLTLTNSVYNSQNQGYIEYNGQFKPGSSSSPNGGTTGVIGSSQSFNFVSGDFSISMWFLADNRMETSSTSYHSFFHFATAYEASLYVGIWRSGLGDGNIYSSMANVGLFTTTPGSNGTGGNYLSTSNAPYNMFGSWHNFVFTFTGSTAKIYINGILQGTMSFSRPANAAQPLYIGSGFFDDRTFWGGISQFLVYKGKCLTDIEVLQNFNAVKVRYGL